MKTQLTKREYLGRVNLAQFKNTKTGEIKYEEISNEQLENMGKVNGVEHNPKDNGDWVYVLTSGGSVKIDTPDGLFGENDYTIISDENDPEISLNIPPDDE